MIKFFADTSRLFIIGTKAVFPHSNSDYFLGFLPFFSENKHLGHRHSGFGGGYSED